MSFFFGLVGVGLGLGLSWVWVGVEFAQLLGLGGCGWWYNCGFFFVCVCVGVLFCGYVSVR